MPDSASFHAEASPAEACTEASPVQDGLRPGMTIEQILADPMVRAVMLADHVEPESFVTLLRSVARSRGRQANSLESRSSSELAQSRDPFPLPVERN